jgi:predicted porin
MKKKLLTLAVAAAVAAPALASAEAIMYGKMNVSIDYADVKNQILPFFDVQTQPAFLPDGTPVTAIQTDGNGNPIFGPNQLPGEDFKGWGMSGNGYIPGVNRANRLGVKGSEDLGNGLKAVYQIEFGINPNDTNNNVISNSDAITMRNTFVGLAGNWGTFLLGRHDTPLKLSTGKLDLFADTMADYNGTVGFQDLRADNAVAYVSPSFSGFQLMAASIAPGGATGGNGLNINSDGIADGYSLAGIYSNGPFYASIAYESLGSEMFMNQATSLAGSGACITVAGTPTATCNYVGDDFTKWRVGLGLLDWNGFTLTGIYENQDKLAGGQTYTTAYYVDPNDPTATAGSVLTPTGPKSQDLWQVQAAYAFGNSQIKAMYGSVTRDADDLFPSTRNVSVTLNNLRDDIKGDKSTWAVGYDYNFSKRTKAYLLYTDVSEDLKDVVAGSEWSGFSLGMMHSF